MELWIARDIDGNLYIYDERPARHPVVGGFIKSTGFWKISQTFLPQITWENSPKKVEFKIIE